MSITRVRLTPVGSRADVRFVVGDPIVVSNIIPDHSQALLVCLVILLPLHVFC